VIQHQSFSRRTVVSSCLTLAAAALGLALAAGCSTPKHVDRVPTTLPAQGFVVAWQADLALDGTPVKSLHVGDEFIVAYSEENRAVAVTRATGAYAFGANVARPGEVLHGPVFLKDWTVFPTTTTLGIYDKRGRILRTMELPFALRSGAVGVGTLVLMGADLTNGGRVVAMDTAPSVFRDQHVLGAKWDAMGSDRSGFSSHPAVYQTQVFAATRNGFVYGLRAADGKPLWGVLRDTDYGFHANGQILAPLAADQTGVYAASRDSKLYCIDVLTGRLKWQYFSGTELREPNAPIVTTDNLVYLPVAGKGIVAIEKGEGPIRSQKWNIPDAVQLLAQDNQYTYLLARDRTILAVDKEKGAVRFRSARNDFAVFGTNLKDGVVYAAGRDGWLYAIKPIAKPGLVGELVLDVRPLGLVATN